MQLLQQACSLRAQRNRKQLMLHVCEMQTSCRCVVLMLCKSRRVHEWWVTESRFMLGMVCAPLVRNRRPQTKSCHNVWRPCCIALVVHFVFFDWARSCSSCPSHSSNVWHVASACTDGYRLPGSVGDSDMWPPSLAPRPALPSPPLLLTCMFCLLTAVPHHQIFIFQDEG